MDHDGIHDPIMILKKNRLRTAFYLTSDYKKAVLAGAPREGKELPAKCLL